MEADNERKRVGGKERKGYRVTDRERDKDSVGERESEAGRREGHSPYPSTRSPPRTSSESAHAPPPRLETSQVAKIDNTADKKRRREKPALECGVTHFNSAATPLRSAGLNWLCSCLVLHHFQDSSLETKCTFRILFSV